MQPITLLHWSLPSSDIQTSAVLFIALEQQHRQARGAQTTRDLLEAHVNLLFMTPNVETFAELRFALLSLQHIYI